MGKKRIHESDIDAAVLIMRILEEDLKKLKLRQDRATEKNIQVTVAKIVRGLRREHGMTQQQLAERAGISQTYISLIESGRRSVNLRRLQSMARALGYELSELIKLAEQKKEIRERTKHR